jgi:uncharacterized protein YggE
MEKTQQAVSVLAICASILLAGMIMTYKPSATVEANGLNLPSGVSPSLGTTSSLMAQSDTTSTPKTLSISGTGVVYVKADQATVILGVYTEDKLASTAINDNAAMMTAVVAALKGLDFTNDDMQTTSYAVTPNYSYDAKMVVSYQVTNMIQIKITDLNKVGPAIDAATAAGVNRVDSISFGIKDETAAQMKLDAYTAAIADAKAKSDTITKGLGITIVGVQSVNESSYYPITPFRSAAVAINGAGNAPTPVLSGNLSVTVTLNIVYLIA